MSRTIPLPLRRILDFDVMISDQICIHSDRYSFSRAFKRHLTMLEYSCHGILWLVGWLISIWIIWNESLFQLQINFMFGLLLDIVLVACIKAWVRRRRPVGNQSNTMMMGPDKYSFPSGHVSRAFFIACFFSNLWPVWIGFLPTIWAWCAAVSVSRILMRRHHLLDVIFGAFLGLLEVVILHSLWISESAAIYMVKYLTDEVITTGESEI